MQDKPLRSILVLAGRATRPGLTSASRYREVPGYSAIATGKYRELLKERDIMRKRLDVLIDEDTYNYIKNESDRTNIPMNVIADDLLSTGLAVKRGEVIEQQSLPVIREIIQSELRKQLSQQRIDLREDMSLEFTNEFKPLIRASDNRIAALLVKVFRHTNIAQRLVYTLLAKTTNPEYALKTYEDAAGKAIRDLKSKEGE